LSGPEIARETDRVPEHLAHPHQKHFHKLGVNNRRAAVRRAEELNCYKRIRNHQTLGPGRWLRTTCQGFLFPSNLPIKNHHINPTCSDDASPHYLVFLVEEKMKPTIGDLPMSRQNARGAE